MRLGRSTGHPGRASTTPEMSVTGPDGWAEPVPAWCTPHEALTRTRAAVASNHRACGPNHRIVTLTAAWTIRWACRFPPRGGRVVVGRVHPAALDHSGGSPPSRPGRGHGADESGDQVGANHARSPAAGLRRPAAGRRSSRSRCRGDQRGPGQQRGLDVRVARAFAAPGSGPVHRDAAADHQLDWPHLAMLALAQSRAWTGCAEPSADHDLAQPGARQEFALSNAFVCRPPPKQGRRALRGAPVPRMPHLAWLARCGIRYLLRIVLWGDVVDRRSPVGETVPGSAAGSDGQGE
jgi:hypothetical protein